MEGRQVIAKVLQHRLFQFHQLLLDISTLQFVSRFGNVHPINFQRPSASVVCVKNRARLAICMPALAKGSSTHQTEEQDWDCSYCFP